MLATFRKVKTFVRWHPITRLPISIALLLLGFAVGFLTWSWLSLPFTLTAGWFLLSHRFATTTDQAYSPKQDAAYTWVASGRMLIPASRWPVCGKFRCSPSELNWVPSPRGSGPSMSVQASDVTSLEVCLMYSPELIATMRLTSLIVTTSTGETFVIYRVVSGPPRHLAKRLQEAGYSPVVIPDPPKPPLRINW